jgi:hypothetical protein
MLKPYDNCKLLKANTMCCCSSHLPHNESEKFELHYSPVNEKVVDEALFYPD